jgi:PE family
MNHILSINTVESIETLAPCNSRQPILARQRVPAAADEVSVLTAAQFAAHPGLYQAVSAQAAAAHSRFGACAASNAATEAADTITVR